MLSSLPLYKIFFVALCLLGAFVSCTKDTDSIRPEIIVDSPHEYDSFLYGDTIFLAASYTDNIALENIRVLLVNSDNQVVKALQDFKPGTKSYKLNAEYILNDPYLKGGSYTIRYTAFDGSLSASKSIAVHINELPLEVVGYVVITHNADNNYSVYRLPNDSVQTKVFEWDGNLIATALDARSHLVCLCSSDFSGLSAYNYYSGKMAWSVKPQSNGLNYGFRNMQLSSSGFLISQYEPASFMILGFAGTKIYGTDASVNSIPYMGIELTDQIIGYFKNEFTKEKFLNTFSRSGGLLLRSKYIEDEVLNLNEINAQKILVSGNNKNAEGYLQEYDLQENTVSTLYAFHNETLYDVCKIDSQTFLLSTNLGIYRYFVNSNKLSLLSNELVNADVESSVVDKQIYALHNEKVYLFNAEQGNFKVLYAMNEKITDFHILYSK